MYNKFIAVLLLASTAAVALPTFQSRDEFVGTLKQILDSEQGLVRAAAAESAQEEGVQEGGIFHRVGKHLVYLRKGVIYSVDASEAGALTQVDSIWGAHPELKKDVWVDEMIVNDNNIVTISHRYNSKGLWVLFAEGDKAASEAPENDYRSFTEMNVFQVSEEGKLSHIDNILFEANDYFSADNYASRFVNGKLVSYSPLWFAYKNREDKTEVRVPQIYRVVGGVLKAQSELLDPKDVFKPVEDVTGETRLSGFHFCSITPKLVCETKAFFSNGWGGVHYVTANDLYFWTESSVFRMSIQNQELAYHPVLGIVLNQFSMKDIDGTLHALAHQYVWSAEQDAKDESKAMLYSIPASSFKKDIEVSTTAAAGEVKVLRPQVKKLQAQLKKLQDEAYAQGTSEARREQLIQQMEPVSEQLGELNQKLSEATMKDREERSASVRRSSFASQGIQANRFVGSTIVFSTSGGGRFIAFGGAASEEPGQKLTLSRIDVKDAKATLTTKEIATLEKGESGNIVQIIPLGDTHCAVVHNISSWSQEEQKQQQTVAMFSVTGLRMVSQNKLEGASYENRSQAYSVKYDSRLRRGILTVPTKPAFVKADFGGTTHDISFFAFDLNRKSFENIFTYSPVEEDAKPTVGSLVDWYGSARVAFFTDAKGNDRIIGVSGYAMAEIGQEEDGSYYTMQDLSLEIPEWQKKVIEEESKKTGIGGPFQPSILE